MRLQQLQLNNMIISRVAESEFPELHVLERSQNSFFRFDEVGVATRSQFFKFGEVENRHRYCFERHRFTLSYFTFLHFHLYIFLLSGRKAREELYVGQAITTPT